MGFFGFLGFSILLNPKNPMNHGSDSWSQIFPHLAFFVLIRYFCQSRDLSGHKRWIGARLTSAMHLREKNSESGKILEQNRVYRTYSNCRDEFGTALPIHP